MSRIWVRATKRWLGEPVKQVVRKAATLLLPMHPVFAKADKGPFLCGTCGFANADASRCSHEYIIEHHAEWYVNVPLDGAGKAIVTPGDCCDFHSKRAELGYED